MIFAVIFIGLLLLVNLLQRPKPKSKQAEFPTPPPYFPNPEHPYFKHYLANGASNIPHNETSVKEKEAQNRREQKQKSVFFTLLFLLSIIVFMIFYQS
jgi:hypothetical protein